MKVEAGRTREVLTDRGGCLLLAFAVATVVGLICLYVTAHSH